MMAGYHSDIEEYGDAFDTVGVLIPCEFCGEQYPEDVIIEHQTGCDLGDINFASAVPVSRTQDEFERVRQNTIQPSTDVRHNVYPPTVTVAEKISNVSTDVRHNVYSPTVTVAEKISNVAPDESLHTIENSKVNNAERMNCINAKLGKPSKYSLNASVQRPIIHKNELSATNMESKDIGATPLSKLDNFDVFINCDTKDDEMDMKDIIISDDEDDEVESIESLWKRADAILKEQLQISTSNGVVSVNNKNNNFNDKRQVKTTNNNKNAEKKYDWQW